MLRINSCQNSISDTLEIVVVILEEIKSNFMLKKRDKKMDYLNLVLSLTFLEIILSHKYLIIEYNKDTILLGEFS